MQLCVCETFVIFFIESAHTGIWCLKLRVARSRERYSHVCDDGKCRPIGYVFHISKRSLSGYHVASLIHKSPCGCTFEQMGWSLWEYSDSSRHYFKDLSIPYLFTGITEILARLRLWTIIIRKFNLCPYVATKNDTLNTLNTWGDRIDLVSGRV